MRKLWLVAGLLVIIALGGVVYSQLAGGPEKQSGDDQAGPAPVEVADVQHGPIELRRVFSGTLESPAQFVVSPKIAGRVVKIYVDVSDSVKRGQVVAELDNDEYEQAVAQAQAELELAKANLTEARNGHIIAQRELDRASMLHQQGIASDSQFDTAKAEELSKESAVAVSQAQVTRAEAALAAARVRLGYTKVPATWSGGDDLRVVAERFVNEGDSVTANGQLLSIIELDPIHSVIHVTEKDYVRLKPGQAISLQTDAFPGRTFEGKILRIAPMFRQTSRQARVELSVANSQHLLKPGMFVRTEVMLDRAENATIVPLAALTKRDGVTGVFVVSRDSRTVSWQPVQEGIRQDNRVQVNGADISGRVVILGQQLISDGSVITIPDNNRREGK